MSKKTAAKKTGSAGKRIAIIAIGLVVIFVLLYIVASQFGNMPFSGMGVRISEYFTGGSSEIFPISFDDSEILTAGAYKNGFYLLTEHSLKLYDTNGELEESHSFVFEAPAIDVYADRIILYDRGETSYYLLNGGSISKEFTAKGDIITASVGKRGYYAMAVRTAGATSTLCVYNEAEEEIFIWNCGYQHIVSVAIADDCKSVVALSVGAEAGESVSALHCFSVDYQEELCSYDFPGATALRAEYVDSNRVLIITDSGLYLSKNNEQPELIKQYFPAELDCISVADNGITAQTYTKYGGSNLCELTVFNKKGKELFNVPSQKPAISLNTNGKYVFLLAENAIMVYNLKGEVINKIEADSGAECVFGNSSYLFYTALNGINRAYTAGNG